MQLSEDVWLSYFECSLFYAHDKVAHVNKHSGITLEALHRAIS